MRECCPECGLKTFKSIKVRRTRRVTTPKGIETLPYGPKIVMYTCTCGWRGTWDQLAKRPSRKSEKRAKQLAKKK